jgi:hypothetical protein
VTKPKFPYWFDKYDYYHPTDIDHEEPVELDGLPFIGRGFTRPTPKCIRWDWSNEYLEGYILDGNWKDSLPFTRFGWALRFTNKGVEKVPRYEGLWFGSGETGTLTASAKALALSAGRALRLLSLP